MIEKVNPAHPDKIADRIAGALVDYAYSVQSNPRIAVEALIGHRVCHIIAETSVHIPATFVQDTVTRIAGEGVVMDYCEVDQDAHLAANQAEGLRCGDNGIFKGMPLTEEQKTLSAIARHIFEKYPSDGKYVLDGDRLIIHYYDGDSEYLYYGYDRNGDLILSTDSRFYQYTAYRPVGYYDQAKALPEVDKAAKVEKTTAEKTTAVKSISRAIKARDKE